MRECKSACPRLLPSLLSPNLRAARALSPTHTAVSRPHRQRVCSPALVPQLRHHPLPLPIAFAPLCSPASLNMYSSPISRIQPPRTSLAFSPVGASAFLGHAIPNQSKNAFARVARHSCSCAPPTAVLVDKPKNATNAAPPNSQTTAPLMVTALPNSIPAPPTTPGRTYRYAPVPDPKPHEILRPKRGRNSRRRTREAEYFRRYMYLRRQLKPWSDEFRRTHGRTPSLIDVHASDVPGLLDRFVEYLDALESLRVDV